MPLEKLPTARITLGRGPGMSVTITGTTEAEIGTPLVELRGGLEYLEHLTPDKADELASALTRAARVARGEPPQPTAFDEWLVKRKTPYARDPDL